MGEKNHAVGTIARHRLGPPTVMAGEADLTRQSVSMNGVEKEEKCKVMGTVRLCLYIRK